MLVSGSVPCDSQGNARGSERFGSGFDVFSDPKGGDLEPQNRQNHRVVKG